MKSTASGTLLLLQILLFVNYFTNILFQRGVWGREEKRGKGGTLIGCLYSFSRPNTGTNSSRTLTVYGIQPL